MVKTLVVTNTDTTILLFLLADDHMNCDRKFDGPKGEIAHSWVVGNIHIDDAEDYRLTDPDGLSLVKVCLHEIGHVLDLAHTSRHYSVMFASFNTSNEMKGQFELGWEDRREVQKIYGESKTSLLYCNQFNPLTPRAAKRGLSNLEIFYLQKYFLENNQRRNVDQKVNKYSPSNIL